ncbi:MAG: sulfatase [Candidatus Hydrogenedentota bacterium]
MGALDESLFAGTDETGKPAARSCWRTAGRLAARAGASLAVGVMLELGWSPSAAAEQIAAAEEENRSKNVVFALIDDLGWADLGAYGNEFNETPHIDRFAEENMLFTDAYAAPVCSPSRAALMSGQDTARLNLTSFIPGHWRPFEVLDEPVNRPQHLPHDLVALPEALSDAGYATAHYGKWHLGSGGQHFPTEHGFDEAIVTGGRHFAPDFRTNPSHDVEPGTPLVDFLTDRTIDFMERHADQPFFVHLSHYAVHIPIDTTEELFEKYDAKEPVEGYPSNPYYAGMLEQLDDSFGRLLDAIDEMGLADDTVVIFYSDNGGLVQRFDVAGDEDAQVVTNNAPLRDEKGSLYEGGVRVPLIVRYPGRTESGSQCAEPVLANDFYPTLAEIAGISPPGQAVDGQSMLPLFENPEASLARDAIHMHYPHYHHSRPGSFIRQGDWKLIEFFDDNSLELYNLAEDIGEEHDLAREEPERAARMWRRLADWRQARQAAMPAPNPRFDPDRRDEWWSRRQDQPVNSEGMDQHFNPRLY